jgi:hypothetical protein
VGGQAGFYSSSYGVHIFSALTEYLAEHQVKYEVDEKIWKMRFTWVEYEKDYDGEE